MKNDLARHVEGARGGASQEREPGGSPFCVVCGRHTATVGRVDLRQRGERWSLCARRCGPIRWEGCSVSRWRRVWLSAACCPRVSKPQRHPCRVRG